MTFRRPNPCCILPIRCDDLWAVICVRFSRATNKTYFQNYCLYFVYLPLSLSHISSQTPPPNRWWMKMNWYSLGQRLSRRLSNGFRTWKIIWGTTLLKEEIWKKLWFHQQTFHRRLRKTRELWRNDRCFVGLQKSMDLPNPVRGQENFCNASENARVLEMRDSLNLIQGNDLGAEWIDHHTDLLLSFALAIWDGKSRVNYP